MIAIIPVAGAGTKLRPHTYTQPKSLIPIAGKPIVSYIVEDLKQAGVSQFVFVIGYLGNKIKNYIKNAYPNLDAQFVTQENRDGLGHAVWLTHKVIDINEEVVIVLGDTIIDVDWKDFLSQKTSSLGIRKVEDPRRFGVAEFDDDGMISRVVEKPTIPKSNMALVGLYKIKEYKALIEALGNNIENNYRTQNEFQLTDGLGLIIKNGAPTSGYKVQNWYDCGQKEILLKTNAIMLARNKGNVESKNFKNSIIIPPVFVGKNTNIENSVVGPNVTVGDHANIQGSIIKASIIGSYSKLKQINLSNSIIGSDSSITSTGQSLNIGDNTELDLR